MASVNPRDVLVARIAVLNILTQDCDILLNRWVMCVVPFSRKPLPPQCCNFVVVFRRRKPVPFPEEAVLLLKPRHRCFPPGSSRRVSRVPAAAREVACERDAPGRHCRRPPAPGLCQGRQRGGCEGLLCLLVFQVSGSPAWLNKWV